jgi:DNA polymerase III delta subunit
MLHVFSGTDTVAVREKAHELVGEKERKGFSVRVVEGGEYQRGMLASLAGGVPLFGGEELYVLDTLSDDKDALEELEEKAELLATSPHVFVVIEQKLPALLAKVLKKHAETFYEAKREAGRAFNVFSLADALARRDKKTLWVLLMRARAAGLAPEEIAGTLFWQLKSLRLAALTKNATEAGISPFVYMKAKKALSKFKEGDLQTLSRSLVALYHDGHLGKTDLDLALERWVLTI